MGLRKLIISLINLLALVLVCSCAKGNECLDILSLIRKDSFITRLDEIYYCSPEELNQSLIELSDKGDDTSGVFKRNSFLFYQQVSSVLQEKIIDKTWSRKDAEIKTTIKLLGEVNFYLNEKRPSDIKKLFMYLKQGEFGYIHKRIKQNGYYWYLLYVGIIISLITFIKVKRRF